MKKITIYTPHRVGGPWLWGKNLAEKINIYSNKFKASHEFRTINLLSTPFWTNSDIVHSVNPIPFRLWRKPYILTIKGNFYQETSNPYSRFYPMAIKNADLVTVPSLYLKGQLGLKNAVVIPNAVDLEKFSFIERGQQKSNKPIEILTVTKFYFEDKAEGVLNIIETLEEFQKISSIKFSYTVLGEGEFLEKTKEKAKNYNVKVKFAGHQNPKPHLENADIFAYYSTHDNMPNVILEAMSTGLPVITNNIGAVSEMIENNKDGIIVNDKKNYLDNISKLIQDENFRLTIGRNARKSVENRFSWKTNIQEWLKIYEKI